MANQFYTICRKCGRQILMTQTVRPGAWIPCDPYIRKFRNDSGGPIYVSAEGELKHGTPSPVGEWGYLRHGRCVA